MTATSRAYDYCCRSALWSPFSIKKRRSQSLGSSMTFGQDSICGTDAFSGRSRLWIAEVETAEDPAAQHSGVPPISSVLLPYKTPECTPGSSHVLPLRATCTTRLRARRWLRALCAHSLPKSVKMLISILLSPFQRMELVSQDRSSWLYHRLMRNPPKSTKRIPGNK